MASRELFAKCFPQNIRTFVVVVVVVSVVAEEYRNREKELHILTKEKSCVFVVLHFVFPFFRGVLVELFSPRPPSGFDYCELRRRLECPELPE